MNRLKEKDERQVWIIKYDDGILVAYYGTEKEADREAKRRRVHFTIV